MKKYMLIIACVSIVLSLIALLGSLFVIRELYRTDRNQDSFVKSDNGTEKKVEDTTLNGVTDTSTSSEVKPIEYSGEYMMVTPTELYRNKETYDGKKVQITELLYTGDTQGTTEYMELIPPDYGHIDLVDSSFVLSDEMRYAHRLKPLNKEMQNVRMEGTFILDSNGGLDKNPVIIVDALNVLPYPKIEGKVYNEIDFKELSNNGKLSTLNGKRIVYEGRYQFGFELSRLDDIWVSFVSDSVMLKITSVAPKTTYGDTHVRMTGVLYAAEGQRYGHLGMSPSMMLVDTVEIID